MIASLPMYDRPETAGANDRLWGLIRDEFRAAGLDAPDALTRTGDPHDHWCAPDLVLSQTCGLPFRTTLAGRVTLVATPVCDLDAPPGHYFSVFVARQQDPRRDLRDLARGVFAYNAPDSQSGWAAPGVHAAGLGIRFAGLLETGSHRGSVAAVAEGRADLAAIDALSWRLISRHDPMADALHPVARTAPTPALPYISRAGQDADVMAGALGRAFAALAPADRDTLGIGGVVRIPAAAYLAVPTPPPPSAFAD